MNSKIKLICPAGNLPSLRAAVDQGADAVYIGFRNGSNARNFPGLNFDKASSAKAIEYAHQSGTNVYLALNTYPQPKQWAVSTNSIDIAAEQGFDAIIIADIGLLNYAHKHHPQMRLHLSVQGSATNYETIAFYREQFNIQRVVLPRTLSIAQIKRVVENTEVEVEVFGFGGLCVMLEGRCVLSSYVTGQSPNMNGVCSPAKAVRWEETGDGKNSRLNNVLIDHFAADDVVGYPTLCKGRFQVGGKPYYAIEEPSSLNTLEILPELVNIGIKAIKIEGRQRGVTYVKQVTRIFREAINRYYYSPGEFLLDDSWTECLNSYSEGQCQTFGAYHRSWQ